ncbi:MAG TPA: SRPBCC family protein, partial [Actinomycetota bacterium]|nr:SRPBCC family protein [Actinomycetota bacterium]
MGIMIRNDFTVPASPEQVWTYLLDVEKVAKCLPGAQLTQIVDQQTYKGKMKVKMGAMDLTFSGTVTITEMDPESGHVVMKASGREEKGKGQAEATVTADVVPGGGGTQVKVVQDINMSGAVAQYGRGMMQDVAGAMMGQFANC